MASPAVVRGVRAGVVGRGPASVRVAAPVMVGRDAELEHLAEALATPPAVAVIEGEAGIGKSRLIAELAARPEMSNRRWLHGGCRRIREPFPLGPVIEAVRGLGADEPGGGLLAGARLSPVTGALRPLVPELAPWLPLAPEPLDDRAAERHRIFRGLTELLTAVGSVDAKAPVVLVLEDLHWADEQTGEFISYLLGDPPKGLSVVVTFRGEEVDAGVRSVTAKLPSSVRQAHVVLAPLDAEQTGTLAASILGAERVSGDFAAHLCGTASGVPFAIEELLALLRARGSLVHTSGGWARKALDELDVPSGVRDPVLERVSSMSEAARAVIEAAAVLQEPAPLPVLTAVSRVRKPRVSRAVEEALTSGLLAERGDGAIGFRHVLAAQAVYEAMTGPHLRDLHRRAATALETLDPAPLGALAHHLHHGGHLDEWAVVAERAADQAIELGNSPEAARLLEDVLRDSHLDRGCKLDQAGQARVAVKLGRAAHETYQSSPDLVALLSEVLEGDLPRSVRGELMFWLAAAVQDAGGDSDTKRRLLRDAVDDLEDRPGLRAWALVGLGVPTHPGIPVREHRAWLKTALKVVPEVEDTTSRVYLLGKIAMAFALIGDPLWRDVAQRVENDTQGAPLGRGEVDAYNSIGMMACYLGHYADADHFLRRALHGARAGDNRSFELHVRSSLALLDFCLGRWGGLTERAEGLIDHLHDAPMPRADVEVAAGWLALVQGEVDAARQRFADLTEQLEARSSFELLPFAVGGMARVALESGCAKDALPLVNRYLAGVELKAYWAPVSRVLPWLIATMVEGGQRSQAQGLLGRVREELRDLDAPMTPATLEHAAGILEASAGRWTHAAEHLLTAAERYEQLECPYEAAQAREQAAMAMFEMPDTRAEQHLRAALATYRRLGASWDEARCTRDARGHGVRIARPHHGGRKGYGEALSPREDAVARRAAEGKTNKEIAAELFLTAATVNKHLGRAMRKLRVHSRAAVAGRLPDRPPTNPNPNGGGP